MDAADRTKRIELFQALKPWCVKLSQLALKDDGSTSSSKELRDTTAQLLEILLQKCQGNPLFDDKIADYVFFPLQHVLRLCQKHPGRLAELATKCLRVLLEYGWRTIAVEFGQQLLLLLTFFAGAGPSKSSVSEELQAEAFGTLSALFKVLRNTPRGVASLVDVSNIPTLGQCLTIILQGIADGPSSETQLEALLALESLWLSVKDQQALSNFLPGTISALTRCLMPSTKAPRSRKVLIHGLEVFEKVLSTTLSDVSTRSLKDGSTSADTDSKSALLTKSWLKATGAQIKLALTNVIKLRYHDHREVRKALEKMCLVILDECQSSLADSAALLVETAMTLASSNQEESGSPLETSLKELATIHPLISELIKGTIYNWVRSLSRVMQSNDESVKQSALSRLSKAHELLSGIGVDSRVLSDAFADSLRNSIVSLLELPASVKGGMEPSIEEASDPSLLLSSQTALIRQYRPIVMPHESQTQTREHLDALIAAVGSPEIHIRMAGGMLDYLRNAGGNDLIAAFWLSLRLLQAAASTSLDLDAFLDSAITSPNDREAVTAELYAYAVSILSDPGDDDLDWRVQAIGLEVVAYTARSWGEAFRQDLVDNLYPLVHLLGSANASLREHAITTLNMISDSCGYHSTSEMIVNNADYLVNAISLKLNTFDISPQAPQVLVMMIRLSGSSLLPYLDDVVRSIFTALDNFHGYPRLVDSLFNVLGEIVDESGKSGQLQLTTGSELTHRKEQPIGSTIEDVVNLLENKRSRASARDQNEHEGFPREPWKDASTLLDETNNIKEEDEEEQEMSTEVGESQKALPTKVYLMVQSIARLGQHYLTNESPLLRRKLLNLISSACRALYKDEDQFLPLVNDIWPVLIKRLYDTEPFVVIAASGAVAEICRCAGDFMSTRIQVEWHDIMKHVRQYKAKAQAEKKGLNGRGIYSQNSQVWEAHVNLLINILEYVRIEDDMFDEMLEVLAHLLASREDIRTALSAVNEDAVWLQQFRQGQYLDMKKPVLEEYQFASLE